MLAQTQERLGRGEVPTRELLDGLVILIAGVMICVPGFVGDAVGLLLLIAWCRHLVIRTAAVRLAARVQVMRTDGWLIDARSRSVSVEDPGPRPEPPERTLGPGPERDG